LARGISGRNAGVIGELQKPHVAQCSIASRQSAKGLFLTRDEISSSYAIIRHNVRTYQSAGVVEVVKGKQNAESELKKLEESQPSSDRHEGWRYFIEKSDQKAGTDPTEATHVRQAELEVREAKAQQEIDTSLEPRSDFRR
jgi:hypothetical protein